MQFDSSAPASTQEKAAGNIIQRERARLVEQFLDSPQVASQIEQGLSLEVVVDRLKRSDQTEPLRATLQLWINRDAQGLPGTGTAEARALLRSLTARRS